MCTLSMIGDHYTEKFHRIPIPDFDSWRVTREEFEHLRREVEDMKALLIKAKRYDEEHGEPDCEMEEKLAVLRKVAKLVGVDLEDVLG